MHSASRWNEERWRRRRTSRSTRSTRSGWIDASGAPTWQLVGQYPPLKIAFGRDANAADGAAGELMARTLEQAGLAPSAQLHLSAA